MRYTYNPRTRKTYKMNGKSILMSWSGYRVFRGSEPNSYIYPRREISKPMGDEWQQPSVNAYLPTEINNEYVPKRGIELENIKKMVSPLWRKGIGTGTEAMKEARLKYKKDILQPYRGDIPSQEFIEAYPDESKKMFTPRQIKKADYVWRDVPGHKRRHGKVARFSIKK